MLSTHTIAHHLAERGETLATAESCTGGLLAHLLTNVAGSSTWYVGGAVTYSNALKQGILGVRQETLDRVGAVSAEVAEQMAVGARQAFDSTYAISVTGIAGPGGSSEEKPVGLVYVGVATPERVVVRREVWHGSREANKQSSAAAAFALLLEMVEEQAMMEEREQMAERASVEAMFQADGKIRPLSFRYNGQQRKVSDWGRQWESEGQRHFLVMTIDRRTWELRLTPATLAWSVHPKGETRFVV